MIKTKLTGLLLQILCLLCCAGIDTEARNSAMQEIAGTGIAAGLETRCAMRDSQGFIWVGTTTGLNCYDGNGRTMYDAGSRLVRETSNMSVSALGECGDNILFGGNSGLYVFDRRANSICELPLRTRYKVSISSMIEKMIVTGRGKVWMGTEGQGVFMFDTADSLLVQNSRHGSYYSDLTEGSDGLIYAASLYGDIHAFDPAVELVYSVRIPGHRRDKNRISLAASGRYIWIASGENLYRLDTASRSVEPVATDRSTGLTNTMLARPDGSILIGSDNGLWRFNTITDSLYHFRYADEAGDNRDLRVTGLCGNTNNEVLILHPLGPIDVLSLNQPSVNFIPLTQTDGNRGSLNRIHTLLPGNDDKSFLAGADKGLYRIDITPEGFVTSHIAATGTQPVTTLMRYGDELWAGTGHNGIFVLDDKLQLKRNYLFDQKVPYSLVSNEINDIFRTRGGDIYVLTNWGICRYDKTNDYFLPLTEFSQHTRGTSMQQDRHGGLWIATNNGLRYRSPEGGIFEPAQHCRNIASSAVSELYVDSRGRLWAATKSHGMFLFDDELGDFRHIDIPMLDSKPVSFIAEDDSRQLWIGVNNMLANVRQGGEVHTYHFSHYPDITPTLNLTPLSRKGAIAIGDRDGFYTLEPARVKPYSNIVKVLPMQLSLPNKEDSRSELDRLGLDRPLYTMERIELPYNDNSLTIGFSAIRPATEPPVRFDYMLQGVDKAWITGAPAPEVTYNNLDVGTYTLLVRPHGIPDAKVSTLEIKILPPWYSSLWARMAYVVLAAMLGWLVFVLARRLMRRSLQRRIRDMRIQNEREVFEAKSRYFVDLVHEIRTPLMLISMPLEQLSEQESADER